MITIIKAVIEALNERDHSNGQLSGAKLKEILDSSQGEIITGVQKQIEKIQVGNTNHYPDVPTESVIEFTSDGTVLAYCNGKYRAFCYAEGSSIVRKLWMVLKRFKFPKADIRTAWNFWLIGKPEHEEVQADGTTVAHPIYPFCILELKITTNEYKAKLQK